MKILKLFILPIFLLVAGCITQLPALEPGASAPPGKVLVIAQLELNPAVKQGPMKKAHFIVGAPKSDEARFYLSTVADIPVDKNAVIPFPQKGVNQMNLSFSQPSVILMDPGSRFIRLGDFTVSSSTSWRNNPAGEMRGSANIESLTLYGDLKIDIPATAKAVYIGTLRYDHNGVESKKVTVVDDYKKAMKELDKMNLGVSSKDVVKSLAKVVRQY
jgi:hypothetical protein